MKKYNGKYSLVENLIREAFIVNGKAFGPASSTPGMVVDLATKQENEGLTENEEAFCDAVNQALAAGSKEQAGDIGEELATSYCRTSALGNGRNSNAIHSGDSAYGDVITYQKGYPCFISVKTSFSAAKTGLSSSSIHLNKIPVAFKELHGAKTVKKTVRNLPADATPEQRAGFQAGERSSIEMSYSPKLEEAPSAMVIGAGAISLQLAGVRGSSTSSSLAKQIAANRKNPNPVQGNLVKFKITADATPIYLCDYASAKNASGEKFSAGAVAAGIAAISAASKVPKNKNKPDGPSLTAEEKKITTGIGTEDKNRIFEIILYLNMPVGDKNISTAEMNKQLGITKKPRTEEEEARDAAYQQERNLDSRIGAIRKRIRKIRNPGEDSAGDHTRKLADQLTRFKEANPEAFSAITPEMIEQMKGNDASISREAEEAINSLIEAIDNIEQAWQFKKLLEWAVK